MVEFCIVPVTLTRVCTYVPSSFVYPTKSIHHMHNPIKLTPHWENYYWAGCILHENPHTITSLRLDVYYAMCWFLYSMSLANVLCTFLRCTIYIHIFAYAMTCTWCLACNVGLCNCFRHWLGVMGSETDGVDVSVWAILGCGGPLPNHANL